ncbi:MAG: glycosyltransferase family 4 protein [Calditrichia bacterium]
MRILQMIAMSKLASGGGYQMVRLSNELVKRGHTVHVIVHEDSSIPEDEFKSFLHPDITFLRIPLPKFHLTKTTFSSLKFLRNYVKEHQIEIIHAHKGRAGDYAFFSTTGLPIPIIINRGVTNPLSFSNALKYKSNKVFGVVAVSQAVKDVMVESGSLSPDKIHVVYGSVDINEFSPDIHSTFRQEFGISDNTFVWGFIGNSGPRKGVQYLLEAFREFLKTYPEDKLVLIGTATANEWAKKTRQTFGKSVILTGYRKDIPNCLKGFDAFVFSGVAEEGLTGTVREAAAMELPIICTDVAGNRELIEDRKTGLLVPKADSAALLEAMIYAREHPDEVKQYGKQARDFVIKHMTNEVRTDKLETIYQEALNAYRHH